MVEGGVMNEMLELQFFGGKVFEGPMHQFLRSALMVGVDNGIGFEHEFKPCTTQLLIDDAAHVNDCSGACFRKEELFLLHQGPPEEDSTKSVPRFAAVAELETLPDVLIGLSEMMVIRDFGKRLDHGLDIA